MNDSIIEAREFPKTYSDFVAVDNVGFELNTESINEDFRRSM